MRKRHIYACLLCLLLAGLVTPARADAPPPDAFPPETPPHGDIIKGPMTVRVLRVIDGDTVVVRAHIWLGEDVDTRVRFSRMDAPEMHAHCVSERAKAHDAKKAVSSLLKNNLIKISDIRLGKYAGRVLAHVETTNGLDISHYMIAKGLARPYHGGKRKPWCTPAGDYRP